MSSFNLEKFTAALNANENPITISVGKHPECTVKRATAPQVFLILELLKSVAKTLSIKSFEDMQALAVKLTQPADFLEIVTIAYPKLIDVMVSLTNLTKGQIENMEFDDFINLAWSCWKVNESFFMTRVMTTVRNLDIAAPSPESVTKAN
jgi:hypothetical protein